MSEAQAMAGKTGRGFSEIAKIDATTKISAVDRLLQMIPAKVISKRAVECRSYARALFHWEQYYLEEQEKAQATNRYFPKDELLQHLQLIYAQIDEPDSIEGISAHLQVLNPEQQIMEHRKAGRWTAAQSWYELALTEKPNDPETQINLLTCLKESGQYGKFCKIRDCDPADELKRCYLELRRWVSRIWNRLTKLFALCSRGSLVNRKMESAREDPHLAF